MKYIFYLPIALLFLAACSSGGDATDIKVHTNK
jgi:hypothetical protein